nr:monocarboxylate transporter 10-like isoform X2 [Dermatophagoides farinae]
MTNNIVDCCENVNSDNGNGADGSGNVNGNKMNLLMKQTVPFTDNDNNGPSSSSSNPYVSDDDGQNRSICCGNEHQQQRLSFSSSSSSLSTSTPPPSYNSHVNNQDSANRQLSPSLNGKANYIVIDDDNHHQYTDQRNRNGSIAMPTKTTTTTTSNKHSSSNSSSSSSSSSCCSPPPTPSSISTSSCLIMNGDYSIWQILHMILVVISSATINGVVFGVVNNFGVFYAYLTELSKTDITALGFSNSNHEDQITTTISTVNISLTANMTTTTTLDAVVQSLIAGVGSFNVGLIFFCSIFASVLSDRYGIRMICFIGGILATIGMYASSVSLNLIYLYITYGLVLGIGASLVYGPSLAILGHYFTKHLGLVNGLVTAGSSAFSIIMPILLRWLLDLVGIQITFKYLSILMATLVLCSLSFKEQIKRPSKQNGSAKKNLANMFFYDALWKNNLYLYWVISIPMGLFGYFVPFCHLVKHARDINSVYQGEVLVMSIGITSMIGRLITGPLADVSRINRICLQQIAFASIGLLTMFLPFVRDFPLLLVCCGLGLFDGTFISLLGPIAFDLVGPEYANQAIGLLLCFCSLPLTTGPPIAAYAYGIYGNYKLAFCLAGIPPIFAAILMLNIIRMQRIQRRRTSTIKLGIDEPRAVFDDVLIVNHNHRNNSNHNHNGHIGHNNTNTNNNSSSKLLINGCMNGEKLHLLINVPGQDNHHYHHSHNHNDINGTTKLKLSNNDDGHLSMIDNDSNDSDNNSGNEKTGLLDTDCGCNMMMIISAKDHHHHHHHHHCQT